MADGTMRDGLHDFLAKRWWVMALRGLVGVIFGIICFTSPAIAAFSLLFVFGAFALIDGILGVIATFGQARRGERWIWLAVEAVASIVIGILILTMPAISMVVLFLVIAIKALVTGVLLLVSAAKLDGEHGRGWLIVAALFNLAFAALMLLAPMTGAKILVWWIGLWALLFGIALIALGFRLRKAASRLAG